jgi:SAM-dependent methyltransferase
MTTQLSEGTAVIQGPLWSEHAEDWATVHEHNMTPVYAAVLDLVHAQPGVEILEVGCGGGTALRLAAERGARVAAIEAAEAFVEISRRRIPDADIRPGDLQFLPFEDESFDVVMGFNSFQYAADAHAALAEARRVLRPGGRVAITTWGPSEECEIASHLIALRPLLPPPPADAPGPFALSQPGALRSLVTGAGFDVEIVADAAGPFTYANEEIALRALMSSGPCVNVVRQVGERAVAEAILEGIAPYLQDDGSYRFANTWRFGIGMKPRSGSALPIWSRP